MELPKKKYNIIYADPPWKFKYYSKGVTEGNPKDIPYDDSRAPQNHYGCMTIDDIYKLPVQDISAENCVLMMWVTYPLLKEGIKTMEEWGFTYKTCGFSWIKKNKKSIYIPSFLKFIPFAKLFFRKWLFRKITKVTNQEES